MTLYHAFQELSGKDCPIGIKSYEEVNEIGQESGNTLLLTFNFISRIFSLFWFRDYIAVVQLCEHFPRIDYKRIVDFQRFFCECITFFNLARQTGQQKWRRTGEAAMKYLYSFGISGRWNFEHKFTLLEAGEWKNFVAQTILPK